MVVLMVVVIVVLVGDQGEEGLHQVKGVDPGQHHQHFVDVVGGPVIVVLVRMVIACTMNMQT